MADPLDNAVWHALTTHHAGLAEVSGRARRYPPEVSPFMAVDALDGDGWAALASFGGPVTLFRDEIPAPPDGWHEVATGAGHQMVLESLAAVPEIPFVVLGPGDAGDMLALVEVSRPGPFEVRTVELGRYLGVRDGDGRLLAMAGERLRLPGSTEVSAVTTHPDARGRGLAAALTAEVCRGILARGETPVLHVAVGNEGARRVYERLGFVERRIVRFAVLEAPGEPSGVAVEAGVCAS